MRTIKAIFKFFLVLVLVCALACSCVYDYEPKDARVQGLGKSLAEDAAVLPLGEMYGWNHNLEKSSRDCP